MVVLFDNSPLWGGRRSSNALYGLVEEVAPSFKRRLIGGV